MIFGVALKTGIFFFLLRQQQLKYFMSILLNLGFVNFPLAFGTHRVREGERGRKRRNETRNEIFALPQITQGMRKKTSFVHNKLCLNSVVTVPPKSDGLVIIINIIIRQLLLVFNVCILYYMAQSSIVHLLLQSSLQAAGNVQIMIRIFINEPKPI